MPIPSHETARQTSASLAFLHLRHDGLAALLAAIFAPAEGDDMSDDALPPDPFWQYRDRAEAIGQLYLEHEPAENDTGYLLQQLRAMAPGGEAASADEIRDMLAEQRHAEFVGYDTVQLEGWIIARTEARLCALAALLGT